MLFMCNEYFAIFSVEMEDRRVTRSMSTSQNDSTSKRSRRGSLSPPGHPGQRSTASTPRKSRPRRVAFLHPDNCMETPEDLAEMSKNINQDPQLLEKIRGNGDTPLISAVKSGHEKCVKFLLEQNPNLETVNFIDANALCCALIKYKANATTNSKDKFYNIIKMLLDSGSDPNWEKPDQIEMDIKPQIFLLTILNGQIELFKLFLNYNVDLNSDRLAPDNKETFSYFKLALMKNNKDVDSEIVRLMLENGAQPFFGEKNDLSIALCQGHIKAIKYIFLYHGSPIVHAAGSGLHIGPCRLAIFHLTAGDLETKIAILKLMHKFGVNLWINEIQYEYESEEAENFYNETNKIRGEPLSLKSLSRIKIMHTMGRNFVKKYKELEIPSELHEFLEFPDE
jgi:hypothetical protein